MTFFQGLMRRDLPDFFDTTQIRDDAANWDALAARVAAGATRAAEETGFDRFARSRGSWVAASLLLAAALAVIARPAGKSSASSVSVDWARALAPTDDIGRAIALQDGPPAIVTQLLRGQGGSGR